METLPVPGFRHQPPRPSKVMGKKEKSPFERSSISLSATTYVLPASIAYLPSFRAWEIPHKAAERRNRTEQTNKRASIVHLKYIVQCDYLCVTKPLPLYPSDEIPAGGDRSLVIGTKGKALERGRGTVDVPVIGFIFCSSARSFEIGRAHV